MLVIVEGIDRVGKTTLCDKLANQGFIILKDTFWVRERNPTNFKSRIKEQTIKYAAYSLGKLETAIAYMKELNDKGFNIVADRLHLTEAVYGQVERTTFYELNRTIDRAIQDIFGDEVALVYIRPENVGWSSEKAGKALRMHDKVFESVFQKTNIVNKVTTTFHHIDEAVHAINSMMFKYDLYFASPFFKIDQIEREERLKQHLRLLGFTIFSPKESCNLSPVSSPELQDSVFKSNCEAIRKSSAVFAITDGKDMGTIWEAGYAFGQNKPVIYYAETLGANQFNLMLAKSGRAVFTNQADVTKEALSSLIAGKTIEYTGVVE